MKKELQDKLFEKYPKLFNQKNDSSETTCMCWGIECGDGWYWLIDNLCDYIQGFVDVNDDPQPEVTQVKEKFGSLRFYTTESSNFLIDAIEFAEHLSYEICEECGSTKNITHTKGWVRTLCEDCIKNL